MNATVLIIGRDSGTALLLSGLLRAHGFAVGTASTLEQARKEIESNLPQIVVLDLTTSQMDGSQACRTIRSYSDVPILVLSPLDQPAVVAAILDAGADDCLIKPVPGSVFVAHVTRLARRTGGLPSAPQNGSDQRLHVSPLS